MSFCFLDYKLAIIVNRIALSTTQWLALVPSHHDLIVAR